MRLLISIIGTPFGPSVGRRASITGHVNRMAAADWNREEHGRMRTGPIEMILARVPS
jgi:hypothetical protein